VSRNDERYLLDYKIFIVTDRMNNTRKTLDTIRRSSQRRSNRRLDRIQRQAVIDTLVSNLW
jgi:hypothetical protein